MEEEHSLIKPTQSPIKQDPFEMIYYGSPQRTLNLHSVNAKILKYTRENIIDVTTNSTISASLLNKLPQRHLGPEYTNLYIPTLPCNELIYKTHESSLIQTDKSVNNILNQAMIKVENNIESEYTGYQSGGRSAIVNFSDKYYRLKGCGNLLNGFTLRDMGFPKNGIELRGCQFRHTAIREIFMCDRINEALSKYGFKAANIPLGVWLYNDIESKEKKLEDTMKRIDKYCSVYEIVGEKRLGVHVFPTIELILFEYLNFYLRSIETEREKDSDYKQVIADMYPNSRIVYKKSLNEEVKDILEIEPTTTYVPNIELIREESDKLNSLFDKYKIYQENNENLVNIFKLIEEKSFSNKILRLISNPELFKEIITKFLEEKNVYKIFKEKVNSDSEQLINSKILKVIKNLTDRRVSLLELIGLIYARTGWESGRIKRIMQNDNINWGTFEDHPFRLHCNAHTDNYVICPRNVNNNKNMLCILDFDMAFYRENFFNIDDETNKDKYGHPDDFLFDSYLNMERVHLEWEFAGLENVISLEISCEKMKENEKFSFLLKNFIHILRDTAVINYRDGYLMKDFAYEEKYANMYEDVYDLIDMILLAGHDLVG